MAEPKTVTLSEVLREALIIYEGYRKSYAAAEARDLVLAVVLHEVTRPGVKLGGILSQGISPK